MARFLLLLHRPAQSASPITPDELRDRIAKYRAWREEMTRAGKILAGEKLTEDGGVRLRPGEGGVEVAPSAATGERISGYFLLQAEDYRQATEIAQGCPHLAHGGTLELRQIEAT